MRFSHLFHPEAVGLRLRSRQLSAAAEEIIDLLHRLGRVHDPSLAKRDVSEREKQGSTVVAEGVAMPHASTHAIKQPLIAHGYSEKGLEPTYTDDPPVHHVFLILGLPTGGKLHLRILARLAGLIVTPGFLAGLSACAEGHEAMSHIQSFCDENDELPEPEGMPRVTVVRSSPDSVALAAHAALLGCRVTVLGENSRDIEVLAAMKGVNAEGEVHGFAQFDYVGTDPAAALSEADLIFATSPVLRYWETARAIAPHLHEGQSVVLTPGRLGGALSFQQALYDGVKRQRIYIAETQLALYDSEMPSPAQVTIRRIKHKVPLSTLPSHALPEVLSLVNSALPYFVPGENVMKTGLDNISTFLYSAVALLNLNRMDEDKSFKVFSDGVTPSVGRLLNALDQERCAVAEALGVNVRTAMDWIEFQYGVHANGDLYQAIRAAHPYRSLPAPRSLKEAQVQEGIACGLVPLASLGAQMRIGTPVAHSLADLACALLDRDLWQDGNNAEKMGLAGLNEREIRAFVEGGVDPRYPSASPAE